MTNEMNMTGQMFCGYIIFNVTNTMYLIQDFCTSYVEMNSITHLYGFLKFCRWKPTSLAPRHFIRCPIITQFIAPLG